MLKYFLISVPQFYQRIEELNPDLKTTGKRLI